MKNFEASGGIAKALWVLNEIDDKFTYAVKIEMEDVRYWVYIKRRKKHTKDGRDDWDKNFSFLRSFGNLAEVDRWIVAIAKRVGKNIVESQRQERHQSRSIWTWKKSLWETLYLPGTDEFNRILTEERRPS